MDENQVETSETEVAKKSLYSGHIEGFLKTATEDLDAALKCYGFTVLHSLPPKETTDIKERLGVRPLEAADLYNRGTTLATEGKWAEAEADLRAALKKDPDYAPAAYNLAVCLEALERFDQARKAYKDYLTIRDRAEGRRDLRQMTEAELVEETARIDEHLKTLGKS
jgi:tetratricopeptide (TPR) repeat protein